MKYTEVFFCGGTNAVPFNLNGVGMAMPSGSSLKVFQGVSGGGAGLSFNGGDYSALYFTDSGDYVYSGTGLNYPDLVPVLANQGMQLDAMWFTIGVLSIVLVRGVLDFMGGSK